MPNIRNTVLSGLLTLALASSLIGCGPDLSPAEHIAKAKEQISRADYGAALLELKNAVQKDPKSAEGRWLLAKVALELGQGAEAEKEARKALELGQSKAEVQLLLAKALLMQGDTDRLLQETESIYGMPTAMEKAAMLGLRGQAMVVNKQFDKAKHVLEEALKIDPNSSTALLGMVALHGSTGQYAEARRLVNQALNKWPKSPEVWSALGDIEMVQGHAMEAETGFGNAIKHRKFLTMDTVKRALVRIQLGKFNDAEADLQNLKQGGYEKHPYVLYVDGLRHFKQNRLKEAADAFSASYSAYPGFVPNRYYLATVYHLLGQHEKALTYAERLHAELPSAQPVKQLLGSIQISRTEYDKAKEILKGALRDAPDDAGLLSTLTNLALLEGNSKMAVEYASQLARLDPQSSKAQVALLMAKFFAGQPLEDQDRLSTEKAANAGNAYAVELLKALQSLQGKRPDKALEAAGRLHQRYPDKVEPLNLMAASYLIMGQRNNAKSEFEKVLKLKPLEPSATSNLARIEALEGNYSRARDLLRALVKAQPGNAQAVLVLAELEGQLDNAAAVLPLLQQAMDKNPTATDVRARLASAYLGAGNLTKVLEVTNGLTATQLKQQPTLLEVRGKAQLLSGDPVSARSTFEQWARMEPSSVSAQYHHGDMLARLGDTPGARKALEKALKLNPKYLPARVGEIKMWVQYKELDKARKALAKLRQDFGERPEVLGIEGWFALGTSDFASAERSLAAALKKNPDSDLAILLVRSQWAQNKHTAALKTMQDWLKSHPGDLAMLMYQAGAYLGLNRQDDARRVYAQVIKLYPRHVPALNNLAWLSQDQDLGQAVAYAREAVAVAPRDPYAKDTLGMLLLKRGDKASAQELLREAAELGPADPQIQLHYGQFLANQQRKSEARKVLQGLIKAAPASPEAKQAKTTLDALGGI